MTTIFNYFQEFKDIYTNNSSFTKGILIDNIDKEINLIKNRNVKLIEDLHKLDLKLIEKNNNKLKFEGNFFILTIFEYENDFNDYENEVNLNMINKHYLFYNNNGFNSGIVGTILNIDSSGSDLHKFEKENNLEDYFKKNKTYSIQITEKFHSLVNINDLNDEDKKNVFIQLLNNINNYYSVYSDIILNLKSLDQIQVYKLDKEISYIYNSKKYKSKYIVKLFDLSTSQIDTKLKNKQINIDKNKDLKNIIKLFNITEYNNFSDINSIIDNYLKYNPEKSNITESTPYFRNIPNLDNDINIDSKSSKIEIYKSKYNKRRNTKNYSNSSEINGIRLIGGKSKKKSTQKKSKKKSTQKRNKKKIKHSKKNKNDSSSINIDLDSDDSESQKNKDDSSSIDIDLDSDDFESKKNKNKYKSSDSESIDITDDDDDLKFDNNDETSVLLSDDGEVKNISDETDNSIMEDMSSELDVIEERSKDNNPKSIAQFFNTDPNRIENPNAVHNQAYANQYGINNYQQSQNEMLSSEYPGLNVNNYRNQNTMYDPNLMNNQNMMYNQDPNVNPDLQYSEMMQNGMNPNLQYSNMMPNGMNQNLQYPNMMQNGMNQNLQYTNMMQDPNLHHANMMQDPNLHYANMMQDPNLQYSNYMQNGMNPNFQYPNMQNQMYTNPQYPNMMQNQFDNQLIGGKKKKNYLKKMKETRK